MNRYYKKNSAQRLIVSKVPIVNDNQNISDVEQYIISNVNNLNSIQYIYVLDHKEKLVGTISIKELFRSEKSKKVSEVMNKEVYSAHPNTDQEHVIRLALKYGIKQVPVIDRDNKFLGVIPADTIFQAINDEHSIDVLHSIGIHAPKDEQFGVISGTVYANVKKRLPWLVIGIVGGFFTASVVNHYENLIGEEILIAAFIPAIAYISDSVGSQTQTLYIRALAVRGEVKNLVYTIKEIAVVSLIGLILGLLSFAGVSLFYKNASVGVVIGVSIFLTAIISSIIALVMPALLKRFNFDPAVASGPFATILRDIASLLIYFIIANLLLSNI